MLRDVYSRQVVDWSMPDRNDTKLGADVLMMSIWRRGDLKNVIVHAGQGSTVGVRVISSPT